VTAGQIYNNPQIDFKSELFIALVLPPSSGSSSRRRRYVSSSTDTAASTKAREASAQRPVSRFKQLDGEHFRAATLVFRNVPNGKLLGKFSSPRLRVIYYDYATGQEIDDFYSVGWWDEEEEDIDDINAEGRNAIIAAFFDEWRVGGEDSPVASLSFENEYRPQDRGLSLVPPFGKIRIVATFFGNYVDSPFAAVSYCSFVVW